MYTIKHSRHVIGNVMTPIENNPLLNSIWYKGSDQFTDVIQWEFIDAHSNTDQFIVYCRLPNNLWTGLWDSLNVLFNPSETCDPYPGNEIWYNWLAHVVIDSAAPSLLTLISVSSWPCPSLNFGLPCIHTPLVSVNGGSKGYLDVSL